MITRAGGAWFNRAAFCVLTWGAAVPRLSAQRLVAALPLPEPSLVYGRVIPVDGRPTQGLRAIVEWTGDAADTLSLDASGRFVTLPRSERQDSVSVSIDAAPDDDGERVAASYFARHVRVPVTRLSRSLDILILPRVWRIAQGPFAGRDVSIDLGAVLRRGSDRGSFGRLFGQQLVGWAPGSFPVPLVLRREGWGSLSDSDSIAFWDEVRAVEQSLGGTFFRPVGDTLLAGRIYPVDVRIDPRLSSGAITFVTWNDRGQIFEGAISFRGRAELHNQGIVAHELLHLLGFGHTASWRSTLAPRSSDARGVTPEDAAYAQLLMRVQQLETRPEVVGRLVRVGGYD